MVKKAFDCSEVVRVEGCWKKCEIIRKFLFVSC